MAVLAEQRKKIVSDYRTHTTDSGSPEVQIALLTSRINDVALHMKDHNKDFHSRRGLVMMVAKRNRLLKYLAATDVDRYKTLIKRLELRK
jgi:small subunit ribosomal protein S15